MTTRFLDTCKHCKATFSAEAERERRELPGRPFPRVQSRYHVTAGRFEGARSTWDAPGAIVVFCACGERMQLSSVAGVKTANPCDERCTEAKGHKCECSCGGHNHGASFAA